MGVVPGARKNVSPVVPSSSGKKGGESEEVGHAHHHDAFSHVKIIDNYNSFGVYK